MHGYRRVRQVGAGARTARRGLRGRVLRTRAAEDDVGPSTRISAIAARSGNPGAVSTATRRRRIPRCGAVSRPPAGRRRCARRYVEGTPDLRRESTGAVQRGRAGLPEAHFAEILAQLERRFRERAAGRSIHSFGAPSSSRATARSRISDGDCGLPPAHARAREAACVGRFTVGPSPADRGAATTGIRAASRA
jgi:hypothetical protein